MLNYLNQELLNDDFYFHCRVMTHFIMVVMYVTVTSAEDCTQLTVDIDTVRTIQSHPDRNQGLNYPV